MAFLEVDDLTPFATIDDDKAEAMVADAEALAIVSAPCLADVDALSDQQLAGVKAVLRSAVLRWAETGAGAVSSQTWGSYGQVIDTRQPRRTLFLPSEITALQKICTAPTDGGAFSVDTAAASPIRFRSVLTGTSGYVGAIAFDNDYDDDWPFLV